MSYKIKITYFDCDKEYYTKEKIEELIKRDGYYYKKYPKNKRSTVKMLEDGNLKIIMKRPVNKDLKTTARLLSLFRKSFVRQSLESMSILRKNDIMTNRPLFCVEYIRYGMVIESYMFYEFLEGSQIGRNNIKDVLNILKKIHKIGYLHRDAHIDNFMKYQDKIFVIDCRLKKNYLGRISENLEYIFFLTTKQKEKLNFEEYINTRTLVFRISKFLFGFKTKKGGQNEIRIRK